MGRSGSQNLRDDSARANEAPQLHSPACARPQDAEDVLQDVFYKLVEANRLLMPIDQVTGWLFRVARNRITISFAREGGEKKLVQRMS